MRIRILIIVILIITYSCKKDKDQTSIPLEAKFKIDSLVYKNYRADIYYKIDLKGGIGPVKIDWKSPSINYGLGPFHMKLDDFYSFVVQISDSKDNVTIYYNYDYRDKLVGNYICKTYEVFTKQNDSIIKNSIDTLLIVKNGYIDINLLSMSFKPDSTGSFIWADNNPIMSPHTTCIGQFYPKFDSLKIVIYKLIYDSTYTVHYFGKKISKLPPPEVVALRKTTL